MNEQLLMLISKQLEEINAMLVRQERQKNAQGKMGRPTKEHIVTRYRKRYPTGKKMECARATGISIKTVSKYWNSYVDIDLQELMTKQDERTRNTLNNKHE